MKKKLTGKKLILLILDLGLLFLNKDLRGEAISQNAHRY